MMIMMFEMSHDDDDDEDFTEQSSVYMIQT